MALLEAIDLSKYFDLSGGSVSRLLWGEKVLKAVDRVNFSVPEGKTFGLVGESGCGKSTTARLVTRLIPATAGQVLFEGKDILALSGGATRELRKSIQVVFQDPFASLNPRMTVLDIVGRSLTLYRGLRGQRKVDRVAELLELVGLQADHVYRFPHEFSGGQRQRIGVARALASGPKLIIADEPVSALDVSVQAQVLNLFKKLQRELKLTLFFISHDLHVVEYMADVVAVMYAGRIMEIGPAKELFQHPLHPYTKGLIASNPAVNPFSHKREPPLRGEISLPINPPRACRLEPRCPIRVDRCRSSEPALQEKRPLHWAACHEV